jgi:hypothetical protein
MTKVTRVEIVTNITGSADSRSNLFDLEHLA